MSGNSGLTRGLARTVRRWGRWAVALLIVALGAMPSITALAEPQPDQPPPQNMEVVGQSGGQMHAIAAQGSYVYVGQGTRLVVFDVSDPRQPRRVGASGQGGDQIIGLTVSGEYAYMTVRAFLDRSGGGVRVIRISDPTHPVDVAFHAVTENRGASFVLAGTYGFVEARQFGKGWDLVDFSDPKQPREVVQAALPGGTLAVSGQYAYLTRVDATDVYDLADPAHPAPVASLPYKLRVKTAEIDGTRLYLTSDESDLTIVDISDPAAPRSLGTTSYRRTGFNGVLAANGRLYFTNSNPDAVVVADPTDPANIVSLATVQVGAWLPTSMAVAGNTLYVNTGSGSLRVLSLADPSHPAVIGSYDAPGSVHLAHEVAMSGAYAYLATGMEGLRILRLDDPAGPVALPAYRGAGKAAKVAVSEQRAYLLEEQRPLLPHRLSVLDLHDPEHPTPLGSIDLKPAPGAMAAAGSYLYTVLAGDVHVLDATNPAQIHEIGQYTAPVEPGRPNRLAIRGSSIALAGQFAYLPTAVYLPGGQTGNTETIPGESGLIVLDISNPAAPVEVAFPRIGWRPLGVALAGSYLYVLADGANSKDEGGLHVFDVSDPTHPVETSVLGLRLDSEEGGVAIGGRYAYVSARGLHALDLADPAHPVEVGYYPGRFTVRAARDTLAYVGAAEEGFEIVRLTLGQP